MGDLIELLFCILFNSIMALLVIVMAIRLLLPLLL
jgi:hypothetical protein